MGGQEVQSHGPEHREQGRPRGAAQSPDLWASPQQPDRSKFKPRHQPMGWGQGRSGPWPGRSMAATSAGGAEY